MLTWPAKGFRRRFGSQKIAMEKVFNAAPPRRRFLRLATTAGAYVISRRALCAGEAEEPAISEGVATLEDVWRTVRDHFYDPHRAGLDWPALRERYLPDSTRAASEQALAGVINGMLSELHASHTQYYTHRMSRSATILPASLPVRCGGAGWNMLFLTGVSPIPELAFFRVSDGDGSVVAGVIEGTPARQAGLLAGDEIVSVGEAPFQPVRSFRRKVGEQVVLRFRRAGMAQQLPVTPVDIKPNKMFLDGMKACARIIRANRWRIGYVHVWCYAGDAYQRALEDLISAGALKDADALIWHLRDGWGGAVPGYLDLFNTRSPTMEVVDRNGGRGFVNVKWRKPVAMLINGGTRSGKEILTHGFKKIPAWRGHRHPQRRRRPRQPHSS